MAGVVDGLLIGQVAQLAGVTVKTVRHYEKVGLLDEPPRGANGYRRYPPETVLRVAQVSHLRGLGVPLHRIAAALADGASSARPIERIRGELAALIDFLGEERDRLDARMVALGELEERLASGDDLVGAAGAVSVDGLRDALGPSAAHISEDTWAIERKAAGLIGAFATPGRLAVDDASVLDRVRREPERFAALVELDAAFAQLRDVAPDDPSVADLARRFREARSRVAEVLPESALPTEPGRAALRQLFGSRLSPAQRRVLRLARDQPWTADGDRDGP